MFKVSSYSVRWFIPYFLFLIPYSLFLIPYFLFLISYSLFLIPYSLFLIPYFLFLISYFLFLIPYFLFLIQLKNWVPLTTYFISAKFNNETSQINCHQSNKNTQWSVKRKTKPFLFAGEQKGIVGKGGESCKPTTDSNCQEQAYFRAQHITFFSNSIDDANQQTACNIDDKGTPRKNGCDIELKIPWD